MVRGLAASSRLLVDPATNLIPSALSIDELQTTALLTARVARRMAGGDVRAGEAYTAGLLHDLGWLVLAAAIPDVQPWLASHADEPSPELERRMLGYTHADAAAYLLALWGLPQSIVDAVAHHHTPRRGRAGGLAGVVHVADVLVGDGLRRYGLITGRQPMDLEFVRSLGVDDQLPGWTQLVDAEIRALLPSL
jgi:HD-like signal output (HDOD) protein